MELIESLRHKFEEENDKLVTIQKSMTELSAQIVDELRKLYPYVYAIHANPCDKSHMAHDVCYVSTIEKACALVSNCKASQSDGVTWVYSVRGLDNKDIPDYLMAELDASNRKFPLH